MTTYEPVAYDKRIALTTDGEYKPIVRMDDIEIVGPQQPRLRDAQRILDLWAPDVWEGFESAPWSLNCFPDARYTNAKCQRC